MQQKGVRHFSVIMLMLCLLLIFLIPGSALAAEEGSSGIDDGETTQDIQGNEEETKGGLNNSAENVTPPELEVTVIPEITVTPEAVETPEATETPETTPQPEDTEVTPEVNPLQRMPSAAAAQLKVANGTWTQNSDGSWWFQYLNKSYPKNWVQLDGSWYYFFDNGLAASGFHQIGGKYYYFSKQSSADKHGRMLTGWRTINNQKFYFDDSGAMLTGWRQINKNWYYFKKTGNSGTIGKMLTGFQTLGGKTYYLKKAGTAGTKGKMLTGWRTISNKSFYFDSSGAMKTGWIKLGGEWYYLKKTGTAGTKGKMLTGFQTLGGKTYYLKKTGVHGTKGKMLTGWRTISKKSFYFDSSGAMKTGWAKLSGKWFYFKKTGKKGVKGRMLTGFQTLGGKTYYLKKTGAHKTKGKMLTGWQTIDKKRFYFKKSSTEGEMVTGWKKLSGNWYYFKKTGANGTKGKMLTGWQTLGGSRYYFYSDGRMAKNTTIDGTTLGSDGAAITKNTIKGLLQNAIDPVGTTIYIWGGGHDDWSGGDALRVGVNPSWKTFYNSQSSSYNYSNYRFDYKKGLDCSGYVGWAVYNTFNTKSNQATCTTTSTIMPKWYSEKGWGSYSFTTSATFLPGDIVSKSGHVWIVLGQCTDGSVVIVHCTPQAGVQIAGTVNKKGNSNSQAVTLAKSYMKKYYSSCVSKFSLSSVTDITYLKGTGQSGINRFRWSVTSSSKMSDPEGIRDKTPAQILKILFGE